MKIKLSGGPCDGQTFDLPGGRGLVALFFDYKQQRYTPANATENSIYVEKDSEGWHLQIPFKASGIDAKGVRPGDQLLIDQQGQVISVVPKA